MLRWTFTFLLLLASLGESAAQTCSYSVTNVNFGSVDGLSSAAIDTTATISINCSGGAILGTVRLCPNLGEGSGGATATVRRMAMGGNLLDYQLYQDSARTTIWGSYLWAFTPRPPSIDLSLGALGSGSLTRTVYARLFGGQSTAPPGAYLSTFSATNAQLRYAPCALVGGCPACSATLAGVTNTTFTVNATTTSNCMVAAENVDFGTSGVLGSNVDAAGQLAVTCTANTSYTVGLNGGTTNSPPASRKMTKGSETVTYGLYKDAARAQIWGDASTPGSTVAGTGTGLAQNLVVYGRVPPQATPSPGAYADTVVVTVTY